MKLPEIVKAAFLVAISGSNVPLEEITSASWQVCSAQLVTISFEGFREFIVSSKAEFSVCKNVFVENNTGWFSDRSAAYLASGRPVILQDTGFSRNLPVGSGLFAFQNIEEAIDAIGRVEADYLYHSRRARDVACEFLDAPKVMSNFLRQLNIT